jgi:AAA domain
VGWRTTVADNDFDVLPRPVNLTNAAEVRNLAALIDWNGYGFVMLDTLARRMVGADENSAGDCGIVVDALQHLREATPNGRGVVLGIHHTGKDGKMFAFPMCLGFFG